MMQPADHREGDDVAPIVGFALTQYGFCHGDRGAVRTAEKRRMKLYERTYPSEKHPA